jgi:hypothetical protein
MTTTQLKKFIVIDKGFNKRKPYRHFLYTDLECSYRL